MLTITFFHPYGYLGLVKATQKIPLLEIHCRDKSEDGFIFDFICN